MENKNRTILVVGLAIAAVGLAGFMAWKSMGSTSATNAGVADSVRQVSAAGDKSAVVPKQDQQELVSKARGMGPHKGAQGN